MNRVRASWRASVLDCGDGVFGVAALGWGSCVDGALPDLDRSHSQSGDSEDSVTAVQNADVFTRVRRIFSEVLDCGDRVEG